MQSGNPRFWQTANQGEVERSCFKTKKAWHWNHWNRVLVQFLAFVVFKVCQMDVSLNGGTPRTTQNDYV